MTNKLKEFLDEKEKQTKAMQHWYEKNPHVAPEVWADGPYPAMFRLIEITRTLAEACMDTSEHCYKCHLTREALKRCESIVSGEK